MYYEFLRVARETRSSTPHHFERRCFVCGLSQELVLAGQLAKTLSCAKKQRFLFQSKEKSRFCFLFRNIFPSSSVFDRLDFRSRAAHALLERSSARLEAIAGPWYFFSKLAARPSLKTPARRLLDVTVARRTCASKTLEKKEGVPRWNQCWTLWARQIGASSAWFYSLAWSVFAERSRSFEAATGTPLAKQTRVSANCA